MSQTQQGTMPRRDTRRFTFAWVALTVIGAATLAFGLIAIVLPASGDAGYLRANGVALTGMGFFGTLIAATAFRHRERWAWFALWYYPPFWAAHLLGDLPPGKDHIHQVVFIALALAGLLLPVREFFPVEEHGRP